MEYCVYSIGYLATQTSEMGLRIYEIVSQEKATSLSEEERVRKGPLFAFNFSAKTRADLLVVAIKCERQQLELAWLFIQRWGDSFDHAIHRLAHDFTRGPPTCPSLELFEALLDQHICSLNSAAT